MGLCTLIYWYNTNARRKFFLSRELMGYLFNTVIYSIYINSFNKYSAPSL